MPCCGIFLGCQVCRVTPPIPGTPLHDAPSTTHPGLGCSRCRDAPPPGTCMMPPAPCSRELDVHGAEMPQFRAPPCPMPPVPDAPISASHQPQGPCSEAGLGHSRMAQRCRALPAPQHCTPHTRGAGWGLWGAPRAPAQRGRAPQQAEGARGEAGRALRAPDGRLGAPRAAAERSPPSFALLPPPGGSLLQLPAPGGDLAFGVQARGHLGTCTPGSAQRWGAEGQLGFFGGPGCLTQRGALGLGGSVGAAILTRPCWEDSTVGAAGPVPRLQVHHQLPRCPRPGGEGPAQGHGPGGAVAAGGGQLHAEAAALDAAHRGPRLEATCKERSRRKGAPWGAGGAVGSGGAAHLSPGQCWCPGCWAGRDGGQGAVTRRCPACCRPAGPPSDRTGVSWWSLWGAGGCERGRGRHRSHPQPREGSAPLGAGRGAGWGAAALGELQGAVWVCTPVG